MSAVVTDYSQYGFYQGAGAPAPVPAPAAPAPAAIPASVYGEQRPTFSDDGTGTPYSTILNLVGTTAVNNDISYDTSSKDPHMIRARVFIGNIARAIITRDDIIELFRPFGKIIAVNYFAQQGFGFVQFSEAASADESCRSLNGISWKTCCLDVHLAMLGSLRKPAPPENRPPPASSALPIGKQLGVQAVDPVAQSGKRPFEDEEYEIFKQNKRNKVFANGDTTTNEQLAPNEMCDTMVCGHCRFVTSDFEEFREHRVAGCGKYKDPEEPRHRLKCATCSQRFLGAWGLLEHLTEFHRMLLYNEEKLEPADLALMRAGSSVSNPSSVSGAPPTTAASVTQEVSASSTPSYPPVIEGTPVSYSSNNGTPQI